MISKIKWQKYLQKMAAVDAKAAELMRQFIEANGLENRAAVVSYAYDLTSKYGEVASELACEMYDLMAGTQGAMVPPAEPADTATIDEVSRGVMYGKYHSPNQIPSIVGRQVRQAGADTMLKNAIRDQVEWAWIPSGDTCAFCITLASRGWQKASKKVLKGDHAEHIHANCDCTFGIAFNEKGKREYDNIYDPQKYEDMYYGADGSTPKQRINSIRRARYQQNKDYINAQKRNAYAMRKSTEAPIIFKEQYSKEFDVFVERKGLTETDLHNVETTDKTVVGYLQKEFPGYKPAPLNGAEDSVSELSIKANNRFSFRIERNIKNAILPAGESHVNIGNDVLANDIHERVHDLINNLAMRRAGIIDENNFDLIQRQLFIDERNKILQDVFVYCFNDESYDEIENIIESELQSRASDAGELIPEAFVSKIGLGNSKLADKIYKYMKTEWRKQ